MFKFRKRKKRKKKNGFKIFFICFMFLTSLLFAVFYFLNFSNERYCKYIEWMGNNNKVEIKELQANLNKIRDTFEIKELDYKFNENLKKGNNPKILVYHHAAAKEATPEKINQWHLDKDFGGIGYHFYIRKDGSIYRGRPENAIGAHTIGKNRESLGICLEGNFENEKISDKQKEALEKLSTYLIINYNLEGVYKHGDFSQTACPGKNFNIDEIKKDIEKNIINFNESISK